MNFHCPVSIRESSTDLFLLTLTYNKGVVSLLTLLLLFIRWKAISFLSMLAVVFFGAAVSVRLSVH